MTALPLFENVPLVSTEVLGTYFEASLIPEHYGDLTRSRVRCIKINSLEYLVGGRPWQLITTCYIDGSKTTGFEAFTRPDSDGRTRQYIALTNPPANENPIVEVSGKATVSSITGRLIENPDEIIEDIARLSDRVLNFPLFREACNKRGLRIAGSVYEARSTGSYVKEIIESCGAKWLNDNAIFYPGPLGYAAPIDFPENLQHEVQLEDVCGKLGVYYGWNHSGEKNGNYIELTAVGCQYENKGVFYSRWLRLARDAEELGRRILGKRAGEFVKTTAKLPGIVRAGSAVVLSSPTYNGPMLVLTARPSEVETEITGELILSTYPHLKVTAFSQENTASRSERIDVLLDLKLNTILVTVFDTQSRPIVGIYVTYDGAVSKKTDKLGRVSFNVSSGAHSLVLSGTGIENDEPYPLFIP